MVSPVQSWPHYEHKNTYYQYKYNKVVKEWGKDMVNPN